MKVGSLAVDMTAVKTFAASAKTSAQTVVSAFIEGCIFGSYRFDRLKSDKLKKKKDRTIKRGILPNWF